MSARDFTDYILDKANDVIDIAEEIATELDGFSGSVDAFIDDAVAAYRDYLVSLVANMSDES